MKNLYSTALALGLCILTTDSFSAVVFSDSFEGESSQSVKNYSPFEFWNVTDGTVDLVSEADGGFGGISCSDGTRCLDLDGSSSDSGVLKTKQQFALSAGKYTLTFALAGNPLRGDTNSVMVSLGDVFSETISLAGNDPFKTFTREIEVTADTSAFLSFENEGGDQHGAILDDVALNSITMEVPQNPTPTPTPTDPKTSPVPLPQAAWLFMSGILGFSVFRKKSKH